MLIEEVLISGRRAGCPSGRHRARGRRPVRVLTTARVVEVTDSAGYGHLVAEDRFTTGCRTGRFVALCGRRVLAGSLTTEEHERCSRCARGVDGRGND